MGICICCLFFLLLSPEIVSEQKTLVGTQDCMIKHSSIIQFWFSPTNQYWHMLPISTWVLHQASSEKVNDGPPFEMCRLCWSLGGMLHFWRSLLHEKLISLDNILGGGGGGQVTVQKILHKTILLKKGNLDLIEMIRFHQYFFGLLKF